MRVLVKKTKQKHREEECKKKADWGRVTAEHKVEPTPLQELHMRSLTEELLVEEERARAVPVLIHQLQELSEDSGHVRGSGRDWGTVVSWQTMQTAQVARERLKKKTKPPTSCHSYIIDEKARHLKSYNSFFKLKVGSGSHSSSLLMFFLRSSR